MIKGLLLFFIFSVVAAEEDPSWKRAVEEILASLTLGPLKEDFSPDYLAKRTYSGALRAQTNRFRAHVATAMVQSLGSKITVCPNETIDDKAVEAVIEEVKQRGFDQVYWLKNRCVVIHLPEPNKGPIE